MPKYLSAPALTLILLIGGAHAAEFENAQTAAQISSKRAQACKHLKGDALEQCLNGYVGPSQEGSRYGRDSVYSSKPGTKPKGPFKGRSEWTRPGRS